MLRSCKAQCFVDMLNAADDIKVQPQTDNTSPISGSETVLTKLCSETDGIKATLEQVVSCLKELSPSRFDAVSPRRKAARISFGEDNNVSS